MWGADMYYSQDFIERYRKALVSIGLGDMYYGQDFIERHRKALMSIGLGEHLEEIFYSNARGLLVELGAI